MGQPLLDIRSLSVCLEPHRGSSFHVVRDVSLTLKRGNVFCLVGESGCGKSMTALSILRLLPDIGRIESGQIDFEGEDLTKISESELNHIRGQRIGMIFQEPMTSLNPVLRVGNQVSEVLIHHLKMSSKEAEQRTIELFRCVGIPEASTRILDYPHQLSGGLRQRVMIAIAMACNPSLILADEPTTALDVTVQGQILALLQEQAQSRGLGVLLITHDLGIVYSMAHDVGVMYAGRMVEKASTEELFSEPLHPYTQGLIASAPALLSTHKTRLHTISGSVPLPWEMPQGCPFRPRCPHAFEKCFNEPPLTRQGTHEVRCWIHTNS